jgi:hypothetical protein
MVLVELADSSVEHCLVSVLCQGLYLYLGLPWPGAVASSDILYSSAASSHFPNILLRKDFDIHGIYH